MAQDKRQDQDKDGTDQAGNDKLHGGSGRGDNKGERADSKGASDDQGGLRGAPSEDEQAAQKKGGRLTEGQGSQGGSGNKTPGGGGSKHH